MGETTQEELVPMDINMQIKMARMEEKVENIESTVNRMETKLDTYTSNFVTKEEMIFRDRETKDLKDNQTWLWRTAIASLIISPIGALIAGVLVYIVMSHDGKG